MRSVVSVLTLTALLVLAGCGASYRPGVAGSRPILEQNLPANGQPEAPGARPR